MQTATRKSWLHAAGLLATTLIALALVGAALRGSWEDHRKAQLAQLAALSRAFSSHVGGVLNAVADDLRLVAGEVAADPGLLEDGGDRLARRFAFVRTALDRPARYAVLGRDGIAVKGVVAEFEAAAILAAHDADMSGDLQVIPGARGMGDGAPGFLLSSAIRGSRGELLGAATARLAPDELAALFGELGVLAGVRANLFRVGGALLARVPSGAIEASGGPGHAALRALALGGAREGSTTEISPHDGAAIVSHFVALPGLPIIPVITVPEAEIWSSWLRANLGPLGVYTLLLIALLAVQAVLLARLRRHEHSQAVAHAAVARDAEAAQQGLAVTDARFRDAIESIGEGFVLWDADDRLLLWNRRFVELTGLGDDVHRILRPGMTFEEAIRALGRRSLPVDESGELDGWILERKQRRVQVGVPWSFTALNGRRLELEERRTSEGGLVSIYRDVDDHFAAMERLAEAESRFRDGVESMDDAFLLLDAEDRIVTWNRSYLAMMPYMDGIMRAGAPWSEMLDESLRRGVPELDEAGRRDWIARRLEARARGDTMEFETRLGRVMQAVDRPTTEGGYVIICRDVTEQKRLLRQANESEARFRDGIESMSDSFALWDREDRLLAWNRAYAALFPKAELRVGMPLRDIVAGNLERDYPEMSAAERAAFLERRCARSRRDEMRSEMSLPDGRIFEIMDHRTSDAGWVSVYRDVTEQRSAAALIEASEARFRDGIESMAEGFVMWDAQDRLLLWNQRARDMLSYISDRWRVGDSFRSLMEQVAPLLMPNAAQADRERWVAARLAAHAARASVEFTTPDGRLVEARDRSMAEGGTITVYRDVSEERRLMRRLAESEARFWDGIDSMGEGFLLCDPQDRIFAWNHQAVALAPEMESVISVGKPFEQFARELLRLEHPELGEAAIAVRLAERMLWRRELGVARHAKWRSGRTLRITENRTSEGGIVTIMHDATAQLRAQAELERALVAEREMNAQQRRFVSIASHEFRTPLAVIDGATQRLMARLPALDPDAARRLDRIRGAVSRMTELIERTLSSARLDEGRIEFLPQPFDLAALLREVSERQRQISPHFAITLTGVEADVQVEGDVKLLEQVFANLMSNAVKYSGRSRSVEVALSASPTTIRAEVRDHGLGIPSDEMSQLFTRFFRARTSMGIPGTGIGLHLVREFVQMHGGRVEVASEIGKGSVFAVTLPRRQAAASTARDAAE